MKKVNLTGQVFGRLVVLKEVNERKRGKITWLCKCKCSEMVEIIGNSLVEGLTKSCGCLRKETLRKMTFKHGDCINGKRRLYNIWVSMRQRCYDPKATRYKYYGGKGIKICPEWDDYISFRDWALSHGYENNLTIDKIDNKGDYKPSNCQFITKSENSKKSNRERKLNKTGK